MNFRDIFEIIMMILCVITYAFMLYYKVKGNLAEGVGEFIALVEESKLVGNEKMARVVDMMYKTVPAPLKSILTKDKLQKIAQCVFEWMRKFAANRYSNSTEKEQPSVEVTKTEIHSVHIADFIADLIDSSMEELKEQSAEYGIQLNGSETKKDLIKAIVSVVYE